MGKTNFTSEQIREQLGKILSTDSFENSVVLSHFLKFIVEETLAGHEKELKEYTIGLKALSKKADFNPQSDPVVRIHAGRLRRLLNEYYYDHGKSDLILISIPKGTYVPEFIKQDNPVTKQPVNHTAEPASLFKTSIAVLPFRIISPATSSVFLADGLGDYISTELTRYSELKVISYYSCRSIVEKISDIREAGLILDAKYILTGTVQYETHRLSVNAQLVKSSTREQIWAHVYEKESNAVELFSLQNEIVKQIVSHMAGHYGAISRDAAKRPPKKNVESPKVYNAIFWYYHFVKETTEEIFQIAAAALKQAVNTDPDYALGWAVLAEIYVGGVFLGVKPKEAGNLIEKATDCAKTALKIDPLCEHGYQALALANLFRGNKAETLKVITEWSKIKPGDSGIMGARGFCLISCGQYDDGYKLLSNSIHLNPYYQWWYNAGISFYYFYKEEYEEAIYWAEKMNMPHIPWELMIKTSSYAEINRIDTAKKYAIEIKDKFPDLQHMLKEYVSAFLLDEKLVNRLYSGLQKSGF